MNGYESMVHTQQMLGVIRILTAYEKHQEFRWREEEVPVSEDFRVERIRLGLQLTQEEFAEYLQVCVEDIQDLETMPQMPQGTGVMFLKWFVERNNRENTPPPFRPFCAYRTGQRELFSRGRVI